MSQHTETMRTIQTKVYTLNELSEDAKEAALNSAREIDNFYADDIINSIKAITELFDIKTGNEWTDFRTGHIDDDVLGLSGIRLLKYLTNNYWHSLFRGKYYSLWSKTEVSYKYHKEGYPVLKSRRSKVMFNNDFTLTGICYDNDILKPVYEFMQNPYKHTTFEDLIKEMENAAYQCFIDAEEWVNSEEYLTETIEANGYEFTEDGQRI